MTQNGIKSFQKLVMYFTKKGKRSLIESKVRSYLLDKKKLKKSKNLIIKQTQKSLLNVTPHVRLLVRKRRRGKRSIYKIGYLEKKRSYKKAYLSVAKSLHEKKKEYFLVALLKEIEANASKKGALVVKRDEIHKKAKRYAPYGWRKTLKRERAKKKRMLRDRYKLMYMSKKKLYKMKIKELYKHKPSRVYYKRKVRICKKRQKLWARFFRLKKGKERRKRLGPIRAFYNIHFDFIKSLKKR